MAAPKTPDMKKCTPKKTCQFGEHEGVAYDPADPCPEGYSFNEETCSCDPSEFCDCNCHDDCPECYLCGADGKCYPDPDGPFCDAPPGSWRGVFVLSFAYGYYFAGNPWTCTDGLMEIQCGLSYRAAEFSIWQDGVHGAADIVLTPRTCSVVGGPSDCVNGNTVDYNIYSVSCTSSNCRIFRPDGRYSYEVDCGNVGYNIRDIQVLYLTGDSEQDVYDKYYAAVDSMNENLPYGCPGSDGNRVPPP